MSEPDVADLRITPRSDGKDKVGVGKRSFIAPKLRKRPARRRAEHVYGVTILERWGGWVNVKYGISRPERTHLVLNQLVSPHAYGVGIQGWASGGISSAWEGGRAWLERGGKRGGLVGAQDWGAFLHHA